MPLINLLQVLPDTFLRLTFFLTVLNTNLLIAGYMHMSWKLIRIQTCHPDTPVTYRPPLFLWVYFGNNRSHWDWLISLFCLRSFNLLVSFLTDAAKQDGAKLVLHEGRFQTATNSFGHSSLLPDILLSFYFPHYSDWFSCFPLFKWYTPSSYCS